MIDQGSIDLVGDIPPNVIVHDMSFDWTGRRLATACSDKTIRVFVKKAEKWAQQGSFKVPGASAWKVKWARPEFGGIIATCSLDTQIRIYELKRTEKGEGEKNEWIPMHSIQQSKAIEDIKFLPNKKMGLGLAIASSDGTLKVYMCQDPLKIKEWGSHYSLQVNDLGISCISWTKNLVKEQQAILAIGCKSIQSSPKRVLLGMKVYNGNSAQGEQEKIENTPTVVFAIFNRNLSKPLEKLSALKLKQTKTINDISWALMNGRSYYLLGVASDSFIKIFELNVRESQNDLPALQVLNEIVLSSQACLRLSWNVMGTYLSGSQRKRIRVWRCLSRGTWNMIKEIDS